VAAELKRLLDESPIPGVAILESHRGGFELIDLLTGYARAILIDCLTVANPVPGKVHRLAIGEARSSIRLLNPHEISIGDAFALATRLGIPMPQEIDIFAIEGADTCTISETMTPEVERAVKPLARTIFALLAKSGSPAPGSQ